MISMYRMAKTTQAARRPSAKAAVKPVPADHRRIQVRLSGVHGKGVFALRPIAAGSRLIEYTGEIIPWDEALRRHPHDPSDPNHTFFFTIDDGRVIDAAVGGNASRWINHACDPNCVADQTGSRVHIDALRDLQPGEELFYDYGLVIDERYTPKLKKQYECRCGSPNCRHTMLAPKR
jgi:SET domain-containing protein